MRDEYPLSRSVAETGFFLDTGDEKYRPINIEEVDEWIYLDE